MSTVMCQAWFKGCLSLKLSMYHHHAAAVYLMLFSACGEFAKVLFSAGCKVVEIVAV